MKVSLRGNFIALNAYIKKLEKFHISDMKALKQHKKKAKQNKTLPRRSRRQEIIKLRVEVNKIETKKTMHRINETKSWFFKKVNEMDKLLSKLTKRQRENI